MNFELMTLADFSASEPEPVTLAMIIAPDNPVMMSHINRKPVNLAVVFNESCDNSIVDFFWVMTLKKRDVETSLLARTRSYSLLFATRELWLLVCAICFYFFDHSPGYFSS